MFEDNAAHLGSGIFNIVSDNLPTSTSINGSTNDNVSSNFVNFLGNVFKNNVSTD